MRKDLDDLLCKRYPKIFRDRHAPMTETAMCWGFEVGDGWFDIINNACNLIQSHTDWKNKYAKSEDEKVTQVVASQIKEKFGELRFYYDGGDDYVRGVAAMAEQMSTVTCETCGKPGKLRGRGWIYTACDEHTKLEHKDEPTQPTED